MKIKNSFICFILILAFFVTNSFAKDYVGTTSGKFLEIENNRTKIIKKFGSEIIGFHKSVDNFFVITKNSGIFRYNNNEFTEISLGLPQKNIDGVEVYRDIKSFAFDPKNDSNIYVATKYKIFFTKDMGKNWEKYKKRSFKDITSIAVDFKRKFIAVGTSITGLYIKMGSDSIFRRLKPRLISNTLSSYETVSFLKILHSKLYLGFNFNNFISVSSLDDIKLNKKVLNLNAKFHNFTDNIAKVTPHNSPYWLTIKNNDAYLATYCGFLKSSVSLKKWEKYDFNLKNITNEHISVFLKDGILMNNLVNIEMLNTINKDSLKIKASNKYSIYLPIHKINTISKAKKIVNSIKKSKINAVVVDLKDDFGYLRYDSKLKIVKKVGSRRSKVRNLKKLLNYLHSNNIYFIARLVSFKDPVLARYHKRKYGIYNWKGDSAYYNKKESWVDPYSRFVQNYLIAVSKELTIMGVDEIQFDYIRFPTDFLPKKYISYRFKKKGMTNRDAIETFLKRARDSLIVPISTDIYGGSGWYNKSTGVGQELEMLKKYVDVICPMYYPSHFNNKFLNYNPKEKRPYRIYYQGVKRAKELSSNDIIVRPYVQAFNLRCCSRYDRKYYGINYIKQELKGCDSAKSYGYGFWNAAGAYRILRKLYNSELSTVKK